MRAFILSAGQGNRLGARADAAHKGLLRIGDRTILEHLVEAMRANGIDEITVVIGHEAASVRRTVGDAADYVYNPAYATGGILSSVECASTLAGDDLVLAMGDHVFDPTMIGECLAVDADLVIAVEHLVDPTHADVKIAIEGSRIVSWGKDLPYENATHQYAGLTRFGGRVSKRFFEIVTEMIDGERPGRLAFDAIATLSHDADLTTAVLPFEPGRRLEVDTVSDLERARALYGH